MNTYAVVFVKYLLVYKAQHVSHMSCQHEELQAWFTTIRCLSRAYLAGSIFILQHFLSFLGICVAALHLHK